MLKGKYESCFYRLNYNKIGAADPITSEVRKKVTLIFWKSKAATKKGKYYAFPAYEERNTVCLTVRCNKTELVDEFLS